MIAAVERGKLTTASAREALTRIETDVVDPARHATIVIEAIVEDLQSKQQDGVATAQDIDLAMELGYERRMGPLRVTDLVGLDVRLNIANHLHRTLGARFEPPNVLKDKVAAGDVGKKTGKGFFEWPPTSS